ncbi:MAG: hypothetical protein VKI83_00200 [Synechococcaceae cyanobacterium]|nr:hypothetical protein [Synechococcaceae cyanobacterium]
MSQLTIKLSDKADALIAQLQKEIFNRRRKKVSPAGVIETLVESGAKSQSDKRFATSWKNLIADIEKAATIANAHGAKPSSLSDSEWAMVLAHRARTAARPAAGAKAAAGAKPSVAVTPGSRKAGRVASGKATARSGSARAGAARTSGASPVSSPTTRTARRAASATAAPRTSVTKRMARAVASRASSSAPAAALQALGDSGASSSNGTTAAALSSS